MFKKISLYLIVFGIPQAAAKEILRYFITLYSIIHPVKLVNNQAPILPIYANLKPKQCMRG